MDSNEDDEPYRLVLHELYRTANVLRHDIYDSLDHAVLRECGERLQHAVDELSRDVSQGQVAVDSLGVLKAFKTVSCPDLTKSLALRNRTRSDLAKELRLMIKTFETVIRPRSLH